MTTQNVTDQAKDAAAQTSGTAKDEAAVTAQTARDEAAATAQTAKGEAAATAQTAKGEAAVTAQTARDQAAHVGSQVASSAAEVVGTTQAQAANVAGEALDQVRDLADQLRTQLSEQAATAATKLSQAVRSLAEELHDMGSNTGTRSGAASQAAHSLAARGHSLADYLDGSDPDTLLADLRTSAARRPGRFLLGAVVAGVLAGRIGRSAKAAKDAGLTSPASTPAPAPATTYPAFPVQGDVPVVDEATEPAYGVVGGAHIGRATSSYDAPTFAAPITSSADSELR